MIVVCKCRQVLGKVFGITKLSINLMETKAILNICNSYRGVSMALLLAHDTDRANQKFLVTFQTILS
jgi:hypothetical protein